MQGQQDSGRYLVEEAPDGTVVIYDSENEAAWLHADCAVPLEEQV
ncbi:DUF7331 family protein [Halorientalis salina]|jgi:hypothetical protein|nr:hypothetical protein [Halorientalis salina]